MIVLPFICKTYHENCVLLNKMNWKKKSIFSPIHADLHNWTFGLCFNKAHNRKRNRSNFWQFVGSIEKIFKIFVYVRSLKHVYVQPLLSIVTVCWWPRMGSMIIWVFDHCETYKYKSHLFIRFHSVHKSKMKEMTCSIKSAQTMKPEKW